MILLYILGALLGVFLLYVLFLGVCALLVDPGKEYDKNSRFYRFLLDSATAAAMKLLRIRVYVSGTEKIAKAAPFRRSDVYLDVLEVFSNIKATKTELIGTAARWLMETNIERRELLWQKDM